MSGNNNLAKRGRAHDALHFDVYARSKTNISRLKARLPDEIVANLAREVIRRVASKASEVENVVAVPSQNTLEKLSEALISNDELAGANQILELRSVGQSAEAIYLSHLAAAARLLGEWWEEDRIDFNKVTLGTGRIFSIMRGMRHLFEATPITQHKTALFASTPGEDHTLGVRMAADLFRKDGWDITLKVGLDHDALVAEIEQSNIRIIGLSIGGEHSIEALMKLVVALTINCPHASIFVSGQNIESVQSILDLMELSGTGSDIVSAKKQLNDLWDQNATA
jgi:methanogenic corrinoid protein MtbC1